jgi:hypothetical protein
MKRSFAAHNAEEGATGEEGTSEDEHARKGRVRPPAVQKSAKRLRTVTLLALEPFAFFVRSPPVAYAQHYCQLAEHMEGLINEDFAAGERPFAIGATATGEVPWFAAEGGADWLDGDSKLFFREQWKGIEAAVKGEGGFLFRKNREPYSPCTPKTICKMRKNLEHAHCTTKSDLSAQEKMELKQISQQFYFFFLQT